MKSTRRFLFLPSLFVFAGLVLVLFLSFMVGVPQAHAILVHGSVTNSAPTQIFCGSVDCGEYYTVSYNGFNCTPNGPNGSDCDTGVDNPDNPSVTSINTGGYNVLRSNITGSFSGHLCTYSGYLFDTQFSSVPENSQGNSDTSINLPYTNDSKVSLGYSCSGGSALGGGASYILTLCSQNASDGNIYSPNGDGVCIKTGSNATITGITVSCNSNSLQTNASTQCTATVQGTGSFNQTATWQQPSSGSISAPGAPPTNPVTYTAPGTAPSGPVQVTACAQGDPTVCTSFPITVTAPPPTGTLNVPASCQGNVGQSCNPDPQITWSSNNTPQVEVLRNGVQWAVTGNGAQGQSDAFVPVQGQVTYQLFDYENNAPGISLSGPFTIQGDPNPIPGKCGSNANNGVIYTPASSTQFSQNPDMCLDGDPTVYPLSGPGPWAWDCSGQYGGAPTKNNACHANTTQSGSCSLNSQSLSFVATKGDGGDQSQNITIQNTSPVTITVTPQVVNAPGWFSLDNNAAQSIPAGGSFSFAVHAITGAWGAGSYVFPNPSAVPAQSFNFLISGGSEASCNQSYAASVSFTVVPQSKTLTSITVNPPNPTVTVGNTQAFTATGVYSDGSTADLTGVATWSATDVVNGTNVATYVGNPAGTFKAQHVGQTNVTAAIHGVTTVTSPNDLMTVVAPATCSVSPANLAFSATVNDGQTQTQAITVKNTSGFKVTVTPQLTGQVPAWFSISPATQQAMDANGQTTFTVKAITGSTAQGSHSYSFDFLMAGAGGNGGASCNSQAPATVNFTVNSGSGNGGYSITVSPSNPSVQVGQTQTFTAVETDPSGIQSNITNTATWSSSDNTKASNVGNPPSTFTAKALGLPSPTITAADPDPNHGGVQGSTIMKVINPNNISLVVLPSQTVWVGTTIKVIASGGSGSFSGWNVQPAGSIAPGPNGTIGGPGGDTLSGSFANFSNPVYTVSVQDAADAASTASTQLNVVEPSCNFTGKIGTQQGAMLNNILPPENIGLVWFCHTQPLSNLVPSCTLSDTNGNSQSVVANGNLTENVTKTTTYTITCQGNGAGPHNTTQSTVVVNTTGVGVHEGAP